MALQRNGKEKPTLKYSPVLDLYCISKRLPGAKSRAKSGKRLRTTLVARLARPPGVLRLISSLLCRTSPAHPHQTCPISYGTVHTRSGYTYAYTYANAEVLTAMMKMIV